MRRLLSTISGGPKPISRVTALVQDGNIFADFTMLANQHQAMNLGQVRIFPSHSHSFLHDFAN
jgi:hypothetical protein